MYYGIPYYFDERGAWFDSWRNKTFFSSPKYNTGTGAHPASY